MRACVLQAIRESIVLDEHITPTLRRDIRYLALRLKRKARDFFNKPIREREKVPEDIVRLYNSLNEKLSQELRKMFPQDLQTPS